MPAVVSLARASWATIGESEEPDLEERFRALVETHFDFAWRTLLRLGVPHAEVDAGTRDVFVAVAQRLGGVALRDELPFLLRTVLQVARARGRARVSFREPVRQALQDKLDAMPSEVRVAFVLVELEGLPLREAARLLGLSVSEVGERVERARERIRAYVPLRVGGTGSEASRDGATESRAGGADEGLAGGAEDGLAGGAEDGLAGGAEDGVARSVDAPGGTESRFGGSDRRDGGSDLRDGGSESGDAAAVRLIE